MADRDLLNKLINAAAIEPPMAERPGPAPSALGKLGVRERPREIGREAAATPLGLPAKLKDGSAPTGGPGAPGSYAGAAGQAAERPASTPAFKAAYFNRDVGATAQVNLSARPLKAMRGEEGASDLRRVVLPAPHGGEGSSEPAVLQGALGRTAPTEPGQSALASLVGKQGDWSQRPSVRPEHIAARQRMLEEMVEARKAALERMRALPEATRARSETVTQALAAGGQAMARPGRDVEYSGNALIEQAESKAAPMRARVAKVLRSKV